MTTLCDILILGSGPGGSLLATVLARSGMSVALVDRNTHPRFAIGESSTPLADATLQSIALQYNVPELLPLTAYGSWRREYPRLMCGLKRGFSYFGHTVGQPFDPSHQLLVAGSGTDEHSDTHWLRSDVDSFLYGLAVQSVMLARTGIDYRLTKAAQYWRLDGRAEDESVSVQAPFVVDATGGAGVVMDLLKVDFAAPQSRHNPGAAFAHFRDVQPMSTVFQEQSIDIAGHPFPCDAAALHHVLEDGWMWQLPFDDGTVSAGIMTCDSARTKDPARLWAETLHDYPLVGDQFRSATICRPQSHLQTMTLVRRCRSQAAGPNWAALPGTVGFVDPLHSTGIAHTLSGVKRLAEIILHGESQRRSRLEDYSGAVISELALIRQLVDGCYSSLPHFNLWSAWSMLYFAAVTSMEHGTSGSFLRSADRAFRRMVTAAEGELRCCLQQQASPTACDSFKGWLREALVPWNHVGLLDDAAAGMYAGTAAPRLAGKKSAHEPA